MKTFYIYLHAMLLSSVFHVYAAPVPFSKGPQVAPFGAGAPSSSNPLYEE